MHRLSDLETIIFDLGEVIVDLDTKAVISEFSKVRNVETLDLKSIIVGSEELYAYETGQMPRDQFISSVSNQLPGTISDDQFEYAWNLMIADIPMKRLHLMKELMQTHRVLILSNTNEMHEHCFDKLVESMSGQLMKDFAHKAYYSHRIGFRKPNLDIYEFVIQDSGIDASKALFLDDKLENVLAARQVGLKSEQVLSPDDIFQILGRE